VVLALALAELLRTREIPLRTLPKWQGSAFPILEHFHIWAARSLFCAYHHHGPIHPPHDVSASTFRSRWNTSADATTSPLPSLRDVGATSREGATKLISPCQNSTKSFGRISHSTAVIELHHSTEHFDGTSAAVFTIHRIWYRGLHTLPTLNESVLQEKVLPSEMETNLPRHVRPSSRCPTILVRRRSAVYASLIYMTAKYCHPNNSCVRPVRTRELSLRWPPGWISRFRR